MMASSPISSSPFLIGHSHPTSFSSPALPFLHNFLSLSLPNNNFSWSTRRTSFMPLKAQATAEKKTPLDSRMLVFVPPHPLIKHWVSVLRNEQTPSPIFSK